MDIHWIDIVILGTLILMFAFSCWKGFIKEAFSLGSLFFSILIANQFDEMLAPYLHDVFSTKLVSEVAAFIIIFIVSVILLRYIGRLIQEKFVNDSSTLNFLNRAGGGVLGLAKGMLILIIVLIPVMNIPPAKDYVYDNSQYVGYVESSAILLTSISTGESLVKKVRDEDKFMGNIREKTRKVYKEAQKSVTKATQELIKSEAVKVMKEKTEDITQAAKDIAIKSKDAITEKDQSELDTMLDTITE